MMNTIFHFLVGSAGPRAGGMQQSTLRVAGFLSKIPNSKTVIYTLHDPTDSIEIADGENITIIYLREHIHLLNAPLPAKDGSPTRYAEMMQSEFLAYKNAISSTVKTDKGCRHLIISFFISTTGFHAQRIADDLRLPHIASIRGTDLNRDSLNPTGYAAIKYVISKAAGIVAINRSHAETIRHSFDRKKGVKVIYNSLNFPEQLPYWQPQPRQKVEIFSDCGCSFKKGTHILLSSCKELLSSQIPIRLTLAGNIERCTKAYWDSELRTIANDFPRQIEIIDWLSPTEIIQRLLQSDIYCSATLGEGCATARLRALAIGIPIVTTDSGEIADFANNKNNVFISPPGAHKEYRDNLLQMISMVRSGQIRVSLPSVAKLRKQFQSDNELGAWKAFVGKVLHNYHE